MTRKEIFLVIARLREELENLKKLQEELAGQGYWPEQNGAVTLDLDRRETDTFTLRALGSIIHDFYTIAENIFKVVARDLDEKIPADEAWHSLLLRQMAMSIPEVRPALLSKKTAEELEEFRAFRHLFRNVYGYNLSSERLARLLKKLRQAMYALRLDAEEFIGKLLEAMSEQ